MQMLVVCWKHRGSGDPTDVVPPLALYCNTASTGSNPFMFYGCSFKCETNRFTNGTVVIQVGCGDHPSVRGLDISLFLAWWQAWAGKRDRCDERIFASAEVGP